MLCFGPVPCESLLFARSDRSALSWSVAAGVWGAGSVGCSAVRMEEAESEASSLWGNDEQSGSEARMGSGTCRMFGELMEGMG